MKSEELIRHEYELTAERERAGAQSCLDALNNALEVLRDNRPTPISYLRERHDAAIADLERVYAYFRTWATPV